MSGVLDRIRTRHAERVKAGFARRRGPTLWLTIRNHVGETIEQDVPLPPPARLHPLTIVAIPSGRHLRTDGTKPMPPEIVALMEGHNNFPEVDAIFAAREAARAAATQALPDTPAPDDDAPAPRPDATGGPTDEQAVASIEAYRRRVRVRLLDKAKALGRDR
jgi:hypothetical protein